MAIESGIALATILRKWASDDLGLAFKFYKDIRKPRTDRVTRTSYEAGLLASAELPDSFSDDFNSDALRDRMKWIMEEDVMAEVMRKGAAFFDQQLDSSFRSLARNILSKPTYDQGVVFDSACTGLSWQSMAAGALFPQRTKLKIVNKIKAEPVELSPGRVPGILPTPEQWRECHGALGW